MESPELNPSMPQSDIKRAYYVMARIILEPSKPTFQTIGAIKFDSGAWKVVKRPLSLNMNELVRVGNLPPGIFSKNTFQTASEYFQRSGNRI